MQMIFYIKGQEVEKINIDLTNITTFCQRRKIVSDYKYYLLRKYADEMMLTKDWDIFIFKMSKEIIDNN